MTETDAAEVSDDTSAAVWRHFDDMSTGGLLSVCETPAQLQGLETVSRA